MNCVICGSTKVRYYFTRHFEGVWGQMLDKSEYHQCQNCGFVFSKTLFEMDSEKWAELNVNLHTYGEKLAKSNLDEYLTHGNQPPYLAQAAMINLLIKNDIIDSAVLRVADETQGVAIEMGGGGELHA